MAEQTAAAPKARPSWLKPLEHPLVVLGELSMFAGQSATSIFRRPYRVGLLMVQLEFMAYGSMFVVGLTGLFTGMVLALQTVYAFGLFNAQSLVGATVEISLARELAPIFTCIVLVARVGSRRYRDRKSTRLNSSHGYISYAVFCLKKKKKKKIQSRHVQSY